MPCFCKFKVERFDDKVECIICHQLMHAKCYNIVKSNLSLIKKTFKCKSCLTSRRLALASTPVQNNVAVNIAKNVIDNTADNSIVISSSLNTAADSQLVEVVDTDKPVSNAALIDMLNGLDETKVTKETNNSLLNDRSLLLMFITEFRMLKKSNNELYALVKLLSDNNSCLTTKLESTCSIVANLESVINKLQSNNATIKHNATIKQDKLVNNQIQVNLPNVIQCDDVISCSGNNTQFKPKNSMNTDAASPVEAVITHPTANGLIERWHRTLKTAIKCHQNNQWTKVLPAALLGLRTVYKEDLKASPAEVIFGTTLRIPGEFTHGEMFVE